MSGAFNAGMVDRRTTAQQADDKLIELKVNNHMRTRFGDTARINATVYQSVVLLTGEALIEEIKVQAGDIARKVEKVKSVSNQVVVVQEISPFSVSPGSRKCTWSSMTPGKRYCCLASMMMVSAGMGKPAGAFPWKISEISPSQIKTPPENRLFSLTISAL